MGKWGLGEKYRVKMRVKKRGGDVRGDISVDGIGWYGVVEWMGR